VALDYELQSRKLLILFTSVSRWYLSKAMMSVWGHQFTKNRCYISMICIIMAFPSMEVLQAFGANEELTEIRREAGAVIESGVMTPISEHYFTNYPDAFIKHY